MKCMNCGAVIPEDQLICPGCGQEIQIVPDYNPLDDVLTAQVRGGVTATLAIAAREANRRQAEAQNIQQEEYPQDIHSGMRSYREERPLDVHAGVRANRNPAAECRRDNGRRDTGRGAYERGTTGRGMSDRGGTGRTGGERAQGRANARRMSPEEREYRRRQAEKKRMIARKKKRKKMMILVMAAIMILAAGIVCYLNSYTGQTKKGYRLLESGAAEEAAACFQKAIRKNKKKSDAYTGLAKVYIAQDDLDKAEEVFLNALSEQETNLNIYRAAIAFYIDTHQESKVTALLDNCSSDQILNELAAYISDEPKFSLDADKTYDEIQALELTGKGKGIYYTTDGTDPTIASTKYTEPIKLDEGETEVRAISVNDKGIPSRVASRTYTIEFPIADAPTVTPATGQYEEARYIEVTVPDKYQAYYTTDGSIPDPANSAATHRYTGPIEMPEGNTIFSVVLVDQKGRLSEVTKRNFERIVIE